ncbi:MAG: thioredoxin family protein [Acidobacteria bacterium]|nr:thioredoxin family protein [Acidobacteriota bacterium]
MAATSTMTMPLGTVAPDFTLPDTVTGKMISLNELKSDIATVVMFICNHCPYVQHVQHELVRLANDYQPKGISFIAISSNDIEAYPDDSPERMKEVAVRLGYPFPYLFDETQEVAKAYDVACTPDFYILDRDLKCVYRGQLDDSRPGNLIPVTGKDIRAALDNILSGKPVDPNQKPSIGCSIKWKPAHAR